MKVFECYFRSMDVGVMAEDVHPDCPYPIVGRFIQFVFIESEFDSHPVNEIFSEN